jgi:hypothetical protein
MARKTRRQMAAERGENIARPPFEILDPGEYSPDWILCYNAQYGDTKSLAMLHKKYLPLIKKMQFQLVKRGTENSLPSDIARGYLSETWEAFENAVHSMRFDEEKLQKHRKTWLFYICLKGYLMSKNRDIIKSAFRKGEYESPLYYDKRGNEEAEKENEKSKENTKVPKSKSAEDEYLKKEASAPFWEAVNKTVKSLSPLQVKVWDAMQQPELNRPQIAKSAGIEKKELEGEIAFIRKELKKNLACSMGARDIGKIRKAISA